MRGVSHILLEVLGLVIVFLLAVYFINPAKVFSSSGAMGSLASITSSDSGDYSSYVLATGGSSTYCGSDVCDTDYECGNLMKAIAQSAISGRPYEVDTISYGASIDGKESFPGIGACPAKDINIEIAPGVAQTVCRFEPITSYAPVGASQFGGISDSLALRYGNCSFNYEPYAVIPAVGLLTLGPKAESVNQNNGAVNLYYSPDYLTFENGDYSHYPSTDVSGLTNAGAFENAYLGAGRMEIYVGGVTSVDGECKFNIYACPRQAIAESMTDSTIEILKLFERLEIYELPAMPYYMKEIELIDTIPPYYTVNAKAYSWNFYDIELDKSYSIEAVVNAIKEGLYINMASHGYFFSHPHWDVQRDSSLSLDSETECWNPAYDSMIKDPSSWYRTRSIRFNCGSGNVCSGTLRIKIGMREDLETVDMDGNGIDEQAKYISGVISVCSV